MGSGFIRCRMSVSEIRFPPVGPSPRACCSATRRSAPARESSARTLRLFNFSGSDLFARGCRRFPAAMSNPRWTASCRSLSASEAVGRDCGARGRLLVRKTISSSGCRAMTKSSPSHLIATCRRYSMDPSPMRDQYIPPHPRASCRSLSSTSICADHPCAQSLVISDRAGYSLHGYRRATTTR